MAVLFLLGTQKCPFIGNFHIHRKKDMLALNTFL